MPEDEIEALKRKLCPTNMAANVWLAYHMGLTPAGAVLLPTVIAEYVSLAVASGMDSAIHTSESLRLHCIRDPGIAARVAHSVELYLREPAVAEVSRSVAAALWGGEGHVFPYSQEDALAILRRRAGVHK